MGNSSVTWYQDPFLTKNLIESTLNSKRKRLTLGQLVHTYPDGSRKLDQIVYHIPHARASNTESIYIKGPTGSGKTWTGYSMAGQELFAGRTFVILDTKYSYRGTNRPNLEFIEDIKQMHGIPKGIPADQIDIISPLYLVQGLSDQERRDMWLTHAYKVPLRFCSLSIMFEMAKLNKKAGYAATFDNRFRELLIRTHYNPKIADLQQMIDEIVKSPDWRWMAKIYKMMYNKIDDLKDLVIDDQNQWSSIGSCLWRAARERKPRWIVFTLAPADHAEDDLNLALVTTVLTEIHLFADLAKRQGLPIQIGTLIDELHVYTRNKDASAAEAIFQQLFHTGRTDQLLRIYLTQRDEQLQKVYQDDITKNTLRTTGVYQVILAMEAIPDAGYGSYLNRLVASPLNPDEPYYIPKFKSIPPLFEVESREADDKKWLQKQWNRFQAEKEKIAEAEMLEGNMAFAYAKNPDIVPTVENDDYLHFNYKNMKPNA